MKLYKRETVVDPFTFEPLMRLTIDVPIELYSIHRSEDQNIEFMKSEILKLMEQLKNGM